MTENEAIKILKTDSCNGCAQYENSPVDCKYGACKVAEATRAAIKALKEIQQYRELKKRLTGMFGGELSLETVVDELERQLKEPDNLHPINAKILTYEDAAAWDAYHAIGTPEELQEMKKDFAEALSDWRQYRKVGTLEECRAAMEKQKPSKPETTRLTIGIGRCKCGVEFLDRKTNYCGNCGQKLDWSDEE